MHGGGTGLGRALRAARVHRGKSLAEASRETRIRVDYLDALEREACGSLLGEVYVRGFLRTYSSYLGLNSDKVLSVYSGRPIRDGRAAPVLQSLPGASHRPLAFPRPGSRTLAVATAVAALLVAGGLGLLSRSGATPPPAPLPATPPRVSVNARDVIVAMVALSPVRVVVMEDGVVTFADQLREGEARSFEAAAELRLTAERGGLLELTVNGHELGVPGIEAGEYRATFRPGDYRGVPSEGGG